MRKTIMLIILFLSCNKKTNEVQNIQKKRIDLNNIQFEYVKKSHSDDKLFFLKDEKKLIYFTGYEENDSIFIISSSKEYRLGLKYFITDAPTKFNVIGIFKEDECWGSMNLSGDYPSFTINKKFIKDPLELVNLTDTIQLKIKYYGHDKNFEFKSFDFKYVINKN